MYQIAFAGSLVYYSLPFIDHRIKLHHKDTPRNHLRVKNTPLLAAGSFFPTPYLATGLLQTLYGQSDSTLISENAIRIDYQRQLIKTPDGGTLSLDWVYPKKLSKALMFIIPGLTGGSQSRYIRSLVQQSLDCGYTVAVYHGRGIEGTRLTTPMGNYLGNIIDLQLGVDEITNRHPDLPKMCIGTSMGGNLILKYAGVHGSNCIFQGIVAVSTPFNINITSRYLRRPWPVCLLSDKYLAQNLVGVLQQNRELFQNTKHIGVNMEQALQSKRTYDFDKCFTIKLLDYDEPESYYKQASCVFHLQNIKVPTLALSTLDDPVVTSDCIPYEEFHINENLILGVTRCGGHLGWFQGALKPRRWYSQVALEFFESVLNEE